MQLPQDSLGDWPKHVFINSLLILIGLELIIQALGLDFEREFNGFVLLAILVVVGYIWYTKTEINN